ncbi:unnamed protein product [Symbiodinium sp. CCMP2592]|nr:unnamed protein product [Symbiodinium sp. CCMP2592]
MKERPAHSALTTCTVLGFGAFLVLPSVAFFAVPSEVGIRTDEKGSCERLFGLPSANASCATFGGCHRFCPANACQCTSQCMNYGNCCPDFLHHCLEASKKQEELLKEEEHLSEIEHGQGINGPEWMLCLVMISFVLTMMGLLCMVNSQSDAVKAAEKQLSCTTVSIFAASTFSIALHGVLIEQLWMGKSPGLNRSAGPLVQARIYGFLSVAFYVFSSCLVYWCRDSPGALCKQCLEAEEERCGTTSWTKKLLHADMKHWSFAVAQLSGHITAFLLIRAFGSLQQSMKASSLKCYLVLPWAAMVLRAALLLAKLARSRCIQEVDVRWQKEDEGEYLYFGETESEMIERQYKAHLTADAHVYSPLVPEGHDASTIRFEQPELAEFCISEYWEITRFFHHEQEEKENELTSWTSLGSLCSNRPEADGGRDLLNGDPVARKEGPQRVRRFCHWDHAAHEASLDGATLVMGFLILQLVLYFHTGSLNPIEGLVVKPDDAWLVLWMGLWSLGFLLVVAVVSCAERYMTRTFMPTNFEFIRGTSSAAMGWCLVHAFAVFARRSSTWMDTYIFVAFPLTWLGFIVTGVLHSCTRDLRCCRHEAASVADAFGIAIGLAWDKAFESVIVLSTQGWNGHYVMSKIILATVVLFAVVPPWFWYLVPRAEEREGHGEIVRL